MNLFKGSVGVARLVYLGHNAYFNYKIFSPSF